MTKSMKWERMLCFCCVWKKYTVGEDDEHQQAAKVKIKYGTYDHI